MCNDKNKRRGNLCILTCFENSDVHAESGKSFRYFILDIERPKRRLVAWSHFEWVHSPVQHGLPASDVSVPVCMWVKYVCINSHAGSAISE